jgi:hypothetical protein
MHDLNLTPPDNSYTRQTATLLRETSSPVLIEIHITLNRIAIFDGLINAEIFFRSSAQRRNINDMMIIEEPEDKKPTTIQLFYKSTIGDILSGVITEITLRPNRNEKELKIHKTISWPSSDSRNNRLPEAEYLRLRSIWRPITT